MVNKPVACMFCGRIQDDGVVIDVEIRPAGGQWTAHVWCVSCFCRVFGRKVEPTNAREQEAGDGD